MSNKKRIRKVSWKVSNENGGLLAHMITFLLAKFSNFDRHI
jgi:hypothetical protein